MSDNPRDRPGTHLCYIFYIYRIVSKEFRNKEDNILHNYATCLHGKLKYAIYEPIKRLQQTTELQTSRS